MKGVIVQVGEPRSIVLLNNGKITAIPTPANCHIGMIVKVKTNNLLKIAISIAVVLLIVFCIFIGTKVLGNSYGYGYGHGHGYKCMMRRW